MVTRLKIERVKRNWTLDDVSNKTGISRGWYWLIEKGNIKPAKETAAKLEKTFGKHIDELLKEV